MVTVCKMLKLRIKECVPPVIHKYYSFDITKAKNYKQNEIFYNIAQLILLNKAGCLSSAQNNHEGYISLFYCFIKGHRKSPQKHMKQRKMQFASRFWLHTSLKAQPYYLRDNISSFKTKDRISYGSAVQNQGWLLYQTYKNVFVCLF